MKQYIELCVGCADMEMADVVTAFLSDYPFETFDTVESAAGVALKGYILKEAWDECRVNALASIEDYGSLFSEMEIEDRNWNEQWERESFSKVNIDDKIIIRSEFHESSAGDVIDVIVAPSMSFGSGHHHTTRMMCRLITAAGCCGVLLDVGCGTGVLSIVALKLGAAYADAVDIDPWSVESARRAVTLNGLEGRLNIMLGTVEEIEGRAYDMVVANINRNIILNDFDRYIGALRTGGSLLLSGFLVEDAVIIEQAAKARGLQLKERMEEDGWVAEAFVK